MTITIMRRRYRGRSRDCWCCWRRRRRRRRSKALDKGGNICEQPYRHANVVVAKKHALCCLCFSTTNPLCVSVYKAARYSTKANERERDDWMDRGDGWYGFDGMAGVNKIFMGDFRRETTSKMLLSKYAHTKWLTLYYHREEKRQSSLGRQV